MQLRTVIYCFFLVFSCTLRAQTFELAGEDTINKVDANGKKQGRWIVTGKHRPGTCYAAGQKVEEGLYTDNKKTGIWLEYYCNGNVRGRITFENGRPNGPTRLFHENGKISEEGIWRNSRWVGTYRLFYDNGQVQHEFSFNEGGRRDGPQKYFHENGNLAIEGTFANGKESGVIKEYYENGDLKAEKRYEGGKIDETAIVIYQPRKKSTSVPEEVAENAPVLKLSADEKPNEADGNGRPGVLNGKHVLYNRNRQVTKDGMFKDNRFIEGRAFFYTENGILDRIAIYKDGLYVGDAQVE